MTLLANFGMARCLGTNLFLVLFVLVWYLTNQISLLKRLATAIGLGRSTEER